MARVSAISLVAAAALAAVPAVASSAPPSARMSVTPRTHLFGAPVTAAIELRGVRDAGVSVIASFAPYRIVHRDVATRPDAVNYTYTLECLTRECLPPVAGEREILFPPVVIHAEGRTTRLAWPAVQVASRLGPQDVANGQLRAAGDAPPPSHRVDPALIGTALAVLAGLLTLATAALVARRWLPRRAARAPATGRRPTPLDYALTLVSVTAGGREQERREALDSLAVVLEEHGLPRLARRARTLAWSRPAPAGDAARQLADEARIGAGVET